MNRVINSGSHPLSQALPMAQQRLPQTVEADRPLTPKQKDLVDLILTTGKSVSECADHLGRAATNLYRDLRKPHVKRYLRERIQDHTGILAVYATRTQGQLLQADSEHVRASVAENILDRHLGKPVVRSQVAHQGAINVTIDLS